MMQLTQVLQQFTARYRNALLAKAALLTGLGAAIVALLSWRLRAMHAPSLWAVGAPVALGVTGAGALAAWMARHWLSARETAAHLDRTLGLQQRLMTAAEVGARPELPALYEALLEDTARRLDPEQGRVPRPLDRTAGLLAVAVLILLLWWPGGSRLPFPIIPKPQMMKPTPPPVNPPPPPSQPPDQQREQPRPQQNQPSPSGSASSSKSSTGGQQQSRSDASQGATSQGNQSRQQGSSSSSAGSAQRQRASHDQPQQGAGTLSQPSSGAQHPSSQQTGARPAGQQAGSSAQPQPTGRPTNPNNMSSKSGGQPQPGSTQGMSSLPQPGQGAGQSSSGNQEELKADIEQLLKEVSGELKDLQGQLAASQDQQHPTAGTSTSPQLYEAPMKLDQQTPGAGQTPLQLQTDTAQTKNQRTVGGTGTPSRQAAAGSPQLQPQSVQLSDAPQDETPASRQPIPPEYRSAFEKLQQQSQPQPAR